MFIYKMVQRTPLLIYNIKDGYRKAFVEKLPNSGRKKWRLTVPMDNLPVSEGGEPDSVYSFSSRRAAFHFFKTGEKFEVTPVYTTRDKNRKRIR